MGDRLRNSVYFCFLCVKQDSLCARMTGFSQLFTIPVIFRAVVINTFRLNLITNCVGAGFKPAHKALR